VVILRSDGPWEGMLSLICYEDVAERYLDIFFDLDSTHCDGNFGLF
jgi:hypothetical protein